MIQIPDDETVFRQKVRALLDSDGSPEWKLGMIDNIINYSTNDAETASDHQLPEGRGAAEKPDREPV